MRAELVALSAASVAFAPAHAAVPPPLRFSETAEGGWQTVVEVPAPEAAVRAQLEDPVAAARFSPDIHTIAYVERGPCSTLRVLTSGISHVAYAYRRCPTPDGWHETLVGSDDLDAYEVRWGLAPRGTATTVTYMVRIDPRLPAPGFLVAHQMRSSITTVIARLYRAVTEAPTPRAAAAAQR